MSWDGLVVVCGGTAFDRMVSSERRVAEQIATRVPVLYVDPPLSVVRLRGTSGAGRVHVLRDGFARLTPVVQPGVDRRATARVTEGLVRRQLRHATRTLGGRVRAVVVANQRDLLGACGERRSIVYATDDFVAAASMFGVTEDVLSNQQRRQARHADLVVCVSTEIAESWAPLGVDTLVLRNGCDLAEGEAVDDAPPVPGLDLPAPVAGFLGNISERIDLRLLESVAETGTSLLLVGPVSGAGPWRERFDALRARPGVTWVGERPSSEMPSYLAAIDVGLTPYADSAFNRASFPLKTLEYLAAGRAVVTSDLPASRWLDTDLLSIAAHPAEFAAAVSAAGAAPRTADLVAARRTFAARHSWAARVEELAPHLGL